MEHAPVDPQQGRLDTPDRQLAPGTPSAPGPRRDPEAIDPTSLGLGLCCYLIWGFFPLYFHALTPAGPLEVIVHRAVWGLIFCLILLAILHRLPDLWRAGRDREVLWRLSLAGALIVVNWTVYVFAVQSGHTVDAALGYFINPLVTVALGLVVLRERISTPQKVAVGLGVVAVVVLVIGLGRLPWVSLTLAFSFGLYALVKKDVAHRVGPLEGMAVETAAVTPLLLGYFIYLAVNGQTSFHDLAREGGISWGWHLALLIGAGFLTMVPLIMFAKAAQGLPLGILGLIQYVAPIMQLLIGLFVFHETMEPARWVGTAIVWVALVVLGVDWVGQVRRARRLTRAARRADLG
ncbi:MAG: EamA family transporter RarD [Actinomyces sp.]|nr:EamA family transporter RarD [Actinomyces sp.]MDN6428291.1 EamA family transporter RarD [Propionibacterium sp.]MDN6565501.1 EamA family transporter RarD [Actinomyces sp.]